MVGNASAIRNVFRTYIRWVEEEEKMLHFKFSIQDLLITFPFGCSRHFIRGVPLCLYSSDLLETSNKNRPIRKAATNGNDQ